MTATPPFRRYTNSIATLNHQVTQMDARLTEIKAAAATNEQLVISQKAEIVAAPVRK